MVDEFKVLSEKMDALAETFETRFEALDAKIEGDRANCQKLCDIQIEHAVEKANLAHKRLDEYKVEFKETTNALNDKISTLQSERYYFAGGVAVITLITIVLGELIFTKVFHL
jgi:hypothetical protein